MIEDGYRFGIGGLSSSLAGLRQEVRRHEHSGFDFVAKGDHVDDLSPLPLLATAAAASERLRLRTYVLNACFWNSILLARDAATLDRLSDGRLELGLGAGTVKSEFEVARIAWRPSSARIAQTEETLRARQGSARGGPSVCPARRRERRPADSRRVAMCALRAHRLQGRG